MRRLILAVSCVAFLACGAGWRRPREPLRGPLHRRQQAQIWHDGRAEQWHAVLVGPDSVSGVPFFRHPDCDSCRRAISTGEVDSIRLGNPTAGFWKSVGLAIAVPNVVLFVLCGFRPCLPG